FSHVSLRRSVQLSLEESHSRRTTGPRVRRRAQADCATKDARAGNRGGSAQRPAGSRDRPSAGRDCSSLAQSRSKTKRERATAVSSRAVHYILCVGAAECAVRGARAGTESDDRLQQSGDGAPAGDGDDANLSECGCRTGLEQANQELKIASLKFAILQCLLLLSVTKRTSCLARKSAAAAGSQQFAVVVAFHRNQPAHLMQPRSKPHTYAISQAFIVRRPNSHSDGRFNAFSTQVEVV